MRVNLPVGGANHTVSFLRRNPALKLLLLIGLYAAISAGPAAQCGPALNLAALVLAAAALVGLCLRRLGLALHLSAAACALLIVAALQSALPPTIERIDAPWIRCGAQGQVVEVLRSDSISATLRLRGRVKMRGLTAFDCRGVLLRVRCFGEFMPAAAGDLISINARIRPPGAPQLPDDFDESAWLASTGALLTAECRLRDMRIVERGASLRRLSERWASALERHIRRIFPARSADYAVALLTGRRNGIEAARRREFVLSGTAHVLALSGMHVMVVVGALLPFLALAPHRGMQWVILTAALVLFCFVGGMRESTLRAVIMFALWRSLTGFERKPELLNILCVTALLLVAVDPGMLLSVGFQLSFAAVAGIALLYGPLRRLSDRLLPRGGTFVRFTTDSLCLTLAAGLIVNPLIVVHFGMASVVSPAANLVVAPLIMLAMLQALPAVVLGCFWPAAAGLLAQTFDALMFVALKLNAMFAALPHAAVFGAAALPIAIGFGVVSIWLLGALRLRHALRRLAVCCAACLLVCYLLTETPPRLELIPRRDMCAMIHRSVDGEGRRHTACLLLDRSLDMSYAHVDRALLNYLRRNCDSLHITAVGPSSVAQLRASEPGGIAAPSCGSLLHKRRDMFAALDSLAARGLEPRVLAPDCRALILEDSVRNLRLEFDCRGNRLMLVRRISSGESTAGRSLSGAWNSTPHKEAGESRILSAGSGDAPTHVVRPDTLRWVFPRLTRRLTYADLSPPDDS